MVTGSDPTKQNSSLVYSVPPQILEKSLRLLFESKDVSGVKQYVQRQLLKVLQGRVSLQDLTFAKEYRGARGYKPGACVPALHLARFVRM